MLFFQVENGINPVFSAKEGTSNSGNEQWITTTHNGLLPFLWHLIPSSKRTVSVSHLASLHTVHAGHNTHN